MLDLIADRFVPVADNRALDLATGRAVMIRWQAGEDARAAWVNRCHALQRLRHPSLAVLVDFGVVSTTRAFEAWAADGPSRAPARVVAREMKRAACVLGSVGEGDGSAEGMVAWQSAGRTVVVPPTVVAAGRSRSDVHAVDVGAPAILTVDVPEWATLAEAVLTSSCRPRVIGVWGPRGSGKSTALEVLAACARRDGLVPVAARVLLVNTANRPSLQDWLASRCVLVLDDESGLGGRALTAITARGPRGHVLVVAATAPMRGVAGVTLRSLSPESLADAVCSVSREPPARAKWLGLARRMCGNPGRFVAALWHPRHETARYVARPAVALRVAERASEYAVEATAGGGVARRPPHAVVRAPSSRLVDARRQLERGHRAAGERLLRSALEASRRRNEPCAQADAAVVLAEHLLNRGRWSDARRVLDGVVESSAWRSERIRAIDVDVLGARARLDGGRLDEGEALAGSALIASEAAGDAVGRARALLELARSRFWRGAYPEVERLLADPFDPGTVPADLRLRRAAELARAAAGAGAFDRASCHVNDAFALANGDGVSAVAHHVRALIRLSLGDRDGALADARAALEAARKTGEPLAAATARLLLGELHRTRPRGRDLYEVGRLVRRLRRATLPFTLAARARLLEAVLRTEEPVDRVVDRHAAETGLHALRLFVSPAAPAGAGLSSMAVREVVTLLHTCQSASDDRLLLVDLCRRLRGQLTAAVVTFFESDGSMASSDGGRLEFDVAGRAVAAESPIPPHAIGGRTETAVPVRYGGSVIGALAVRWSLGAPVEPSALSILSVAAAAAAPALVAVRAARHAGAARPGDELLGISAAIATLRASIAAAAAAPFPVLVLGESGSGKELVSRALHRAGPRQAQPFRALNCAALPDDLVESELFGHVRGAFTGAAADRAGVFEEAHGGTLMLDEIGELSLRAQAKVLRTVQDGEVRRLGENVTRRVDVRLVAATNRSLHEEAAAGRFRIDLLYRLDVIRLSVPPLRDRREDIAVLAAHYWREATMRMGSRAVLGAATLDALGRHDWPGNVRELQNVLAALAVRSPRRGVVSPSALPWSVGSAGPPSPQTLATARQTFDREFVRAALVRTGGHRGRTAEELGLSRQGLTKLLVRLGLSGQDR